MIKTGTPLTKLDELSDKLILVSDSENSEEKSSITKLFTRDFRSITLMCYLCMFAACMASVGMFLDGGSDPEMLLINNVWLCLFDMIGYILLPMVLDKLGRVNAHALCFATMGTCLIVSRCLLIYCEVTPTINWIAYVLLNIGKTANAITFGGMFRYELILEISLLSNL